MHGCISSFLQNQITDQSFYKLKITDETTSDGALLYRVTAGREVGFFDAEVFESSWAGRFLLCGYKWPSLRTLFNWLRSQEGPSLRIHAAHPCHGGYNFQNAYIIVGGKGRIDVSHSILKRSFAGKILLNEWTAVPLWRALLSCFSS